MGKFRPALTAQDGFKVSLVKLCQWLEMPRRTVYYRLAPALLVHANDQGVVRRAQVQAHHLAPLLDEEPVGGQLDSLGAMRLKTEQLEYRCTLVLEMPVSAATVCALQCVEPFAGLMCSEVLINCSTRS